MRTDADVLDELTRWVRPTAPIPTGDGGATAPDLLLYLVQLVERNRPKLIIELGSGISTYWLATALHAFGATGRLVSLEHSDDYRDQALRQFSDLGVTHVAEVRRAHLEDITVHGVPRPWYRRSSWQELRDCDLLFVDGPPGWSAPRARYPAVPLLAEALSPGATVVLDDYDRPDEREILALWREAHPCWTFTSLPHRKGTATLTLPS